MKTQINNLKDYAELAQASYFNFNFLNTRNIFELDSNQEKIQDKNSLRGYREIKVNLEHVVSQKYKDKEVLIGLRQDDTWQSKMLNFFDEKTNFDKLNGEFGEIQAQNFAKRYTIKFHQPNTTSGFSATLFEYTKDNNQKIIAIRGTEPKSNFSVDILDADVDLALGKVPYNQYLDMIKFYSECVKEFPNIKEDRGLIIVGHSLGGALAQLLTLSLASVNSSANVKEIYTFNSPGAKELKALNLNQIYNIDEKIINSDNKEQALFYQIRSYKYQKSIEISLIGYDSNLFQNIKSYFHNKKNLKEHYIFIKTNIIYGKSTSYFYDIFEVDEVFINCVNQLLTNLNTKNILATSDNTYHIETDTDSDASNAKGVIQDLGVDIDGKHYIINLGDQFWDSHFLEPTIIELNYI